MAITAIIRAMPSTGNRRAQPCRLASARVVAGCVATAITAICPQIISTAAASATSAVSPPCSTLFWSTTSPTSVWTMDGRKKPSTAIGINTPVRPPRTCVVLSQIAPIFTVMPSPALALALPPYASARRLL